MRFGKGTLAQGQNSGTMMWLMQYAIYLVLLAVILVIILLSLQY